MDDVSNLPHGTLIEGLRIEDLVGTGGMGAVYRAVDTRLDRAVAVKFLTARRDAAISIERFRREAASVAQCNHPGIVQIHSWGEYEGFPFFTMEFVDGLPVNAHLSKGRMLREKTAIEIDALIAAGYLRPDPTQPYFLRDPLRYPPEDPEHLDEVVDLIANVADALASAHARGIVHRDIKPTNVMIDRSGKPKIVDFGLAFRADLSDLTESRQLLGTLRYMAPEQFATNRELIGPPTDVYSLGVLLYELATFVHPIEDAEMLAVIGQIVTKGITPPGVHNPRIARPLARVIERCLAKSPGDRFPSAEALADELRLAGERRTGGIRALASVLRSPGHARSTPRPPAGTDASASAPTAARGRPERELRVEGTGNLAPSAYGAALFDRAAAHFRDRLDVGRALSLLEPALMDAPFHVPGFLLLLGIREFLNDEDSCFEIVRGLVERRAQFGESGRLLVDIVAALREEMDYAAAHAAIRKHHGSHPHVEGLSWPEIEACLGLGEFDRARRMAENLVRQRPSSAAFRWYAARLFLHAGCAEKGWQLLDGTSAQQGMESLHLPASLLALELGRTADAKRHAEMLAASPVTHFWILDAVMRIALAEGDGERAFRTARERVNLAGEGLEKARAYAWLGRLARITRRDDDAARYEEIAQRMNPSARPVTSEDVVPAAGDGEGAGGGPARDALLLLVADELRSAAWRRPWFRPLVHATLYNLSTASRVERVDGVGQVNDRMTDLRTARIPLSGAPEGPFITARGETLAVHLGPPSAHGGIQALARLGEPLRPGDRLIVATPLDPLDRDGGTTIPPADETAAPVPLTRLIVIESAAGATDAVDARITTEGATRLDIDDGRRRLLVFRQDLHRGERPAPVVRF